MKKTIQRRKYKLVFNLHGKQYKAFFNNKIELFKYLIFAEESSRVFNIKSYIFDGKKYKEFVFVEK